MPDVWTLHPQMLKDFLAQAGIKCGVEPRVLRPRDAQWTCHVNGEGWIGDIYIHHALSPFSQNPLIEYLTPFLLVVFALGYLMGKWRARKERLQKNVSRKDCDLLLKQR